MLSLCPSVLSVLAAALYARHRTPHVALVHDIQSGLAAALDLSASTAALIILRRLERTILDRADRLVVLSQGMKEVLRTNGVRTAISVLPPQVDTEAIRPEPVPEAARDRVLYSGNLGRKQGLEQVLAMAVRLQQLRPTARIVIRGEGSRRSVLEATARDLGLTNTQFEDLAPAAELSRAMSAAAVHLVPQRPEGADFAVPSKLFTIMAAGRPAICTAVPGAPLHALMGETGAVLCVAPNEPEAFAAAVAALLHDPERAQAMGARGRAYVERHMSRSAMVEDLCAAIDAATQFQSHAEQRPALI